ncbi:Calcium dependent mitochondrial carrier protein [Colletotrichum higginsianum IMI 349063]|uniref:Mitochondrial thiamine pyrophosphate carrier 1 n=2 Tax=Colletotrichum higginsianum (strain IMI 349063) TaxID=759273 RepID=A0A1B7XUS4_COLHI|nr:Calcium dependent mitochondrial carrier protein [Colletotrichum higginsianum IMI 349063]OBR03490.1 Calcium dependent mitochondrial carrier protein [Colletotrichum higginsianum IMI 349063]
MGVTEWVAERQMEVEESQNQRDKRVEDLWRQLDPNGSGHLDFKGLQKGLRKIDHPMKNADHMLRKIMTVVDTNDDGKIQYEGESSVAWDWSYWPGSPVLRRLREIAADDDLPPEFRCFVEQTERQLMFLFQSIDKDNDGRLDKTELQEAFRRAGLVVPMRKLASFFGDIDMNNDGYISFEEWRHAPLKAVMDFYSSIVTLSAEGDSMVSEETLEGSGTTGFLLQTLFGSILKLASPSYSDPSAGNIQLLSDEDGNSVAVVVPSREGPGSGPPGLSQLPASPKQQRRRSLSKNNNSDSNNSSSGYATASADLDPASSQQQTSSAQAMVLPISPPGYSGTSANMNNMNMEAAVLQACIQAADEKPTGIPGRPPGVGTSQANQVTGSSSEQGSSSSSDATVAPKFKRLTDFVPDPGYFIAGAVAGGLSRTATAPLDRLKVYLLVNTRASTDTAASALKQGRPLLALRNAVKPFGDAVKDLWKAGGMRSLFAGNGLNVIKIMPESAIKFGSYEAAKRTLSKLEGHNDPRQINSYSKFVAGGVAGMVAQFCVYPLDTLKFRLQTSTVQGGLSGNALVLDTAKKMWQAGGVRIAYRGVTMGLMGMFPYSAIDMGTFEFLKTSYKRYMSKYRGIHEEDAKPGNIMTGIIGATSGAFGASVVYPLNVLRTRLQTQGTVMHPATYTGIMDVAQQTLKNEGVRGMYKGLTPNLLKVAPALSITWVVYENSKRLLGLE